MLFHGCIAVDLGKSNFIAMNARIRQLGALSIIELEWALMEKGQ